jgi:Flp pilus assembly protein TadD
VKGVGLGDFYATMPRYWSPSDQRAFVEENTVTRNAHNDYLEIGAETGIPGLAAFLLVLTVAAVLIAQRLAGERCFRSRAALAAIGAGLAGISAQAAFTFSLQNASSALLFWTLLGLAAGMIRSGPQGSAEPAPPPRTGLSRPIRMLLYTVAVALVCLVPGRFRTMGADYHIRAAETLLEEQKFVEAVSELDRALVLDPLNFEALFKKGGAMTALGENPQAEQAYRRSLEFRPNDVLTLTNLGLLLLNETRVEEALPLLRSACAVAPNDLIARRGLASCHAALGNQALAISELRTALYYYPEDVQVVLELAGCYARAGRIEDAVAQYERALSLDAHSGTALIELGSLYVASGNHAAASELLERALLVNPAATEGRVALAQAYLRGGHLLEAALECGNYIVRGGTDLERARSLALQIEAQLTTARWRHEQARAELVRFVLARIFLAFAEPEHARQQLTQIAGHNESLLLKERVRQTLTQLERQAVEAGSGQSDDM